MTESNILSLSDLGYLTYVSSAILRPSQSDLKRLLEISRRNNATRGVTGLLLYRDGKFFQYLEGSPVTVKKTYEHIRLDKRHFSIRTVSTGPLDVRFFPEWSMGYKNLGGIRSDNTEGYSECLQANARPAIEPDPAERLVEVFYNLIGIPRL